MKICNIISEIRETVAAERVTGKRIGFVPTMGALHEGHLSLVDVARQSSDYVVMSIFVNPTQFGPNEDYARYPRDLSADSSMAEQQGVDVIFAPSAEEIYPGAPGVTINPGPAAELWEGAIRPGHFAGVLTVVSKLFNIVEPDCVVFGQKDLQQASLISAMIRDLNFSIEMIVSPTIREHDGLAMSSRNRYLSPEDRKRAVLLSQALYAVRDSFEKGETDAAHLQKIGRNRIGKDSGIELDYLSVVDISSMQPIQHAERGCAVIIAARVGATRLIDNTIL